MRKIIENQTAYLKNTLAQIEYRLKNVPKGYLKIQARKGKVYYCLLYTSPSPRD